MEPAQFDLQTLVDRDVSYKKPFVCGGGKEKCDRRCEIAMIEIEGKKYPFGGACNRYYNLRRKVSYDVQKLDLVRLRQNLIFNKYGKTQPGGQTRPRGSIGFNRSFLVNSYYPLYSHFFTEPLESMMKEQEIYGLFLLDRRECTIGMLRGNRVTTLKYMTSQVPGKHGRGGQSQRRFERLTELAAHEWFVKCGEKASEIFLGEEN